MAGEQAAILQAISDLSRRLDNGLESTRTAFTNALTDATERQSEERRRLYERIENLTLRGCVHQETHAVAIKDYGTRLAALEAAKQRQAGAMLAAGAGAGFIGTMLANAGKFIMWLKGGTPQ